MSPNHQSQVTPRTVWVVSINLVAVSLLLLLVYYLRTVVVITVVAAFLALVFNPLVRRMERHGIKRWLGVALLSTGVVIVFTATVAFFVPTVIAQGKNLADAAPDILSRLRQMEFIQWADSRFRILENIQSEAGGYIREMLGSVLSVLAITVNFILHVGMTLIMAIFILIFGGELMQSLLGLLSPSRRFLYMRLFDRLERTIGGYVLGTIIVAFIGAVIITVPLLLLRVEYFLPLAVVMFVTGLIPIIGPWIGAVAIVGTTLAVSGFFAGLVMGIVFLVYHFVESNLLQPVVQHRTIRMNPLIIILAMFAGLTLAGILGGILALPFAGAVQIVLKEYVQRQRHGPIPQKPSQTVAVVEKVENDKKGESVLPRQPPPV